MGEVPSNLRSYSSPSWLSFPGRPVSFHQPEMPAEPHPPPRPLPSYNCLHFRIFELQCLAYQLLASSGTAASGPRAGSSFFRSGSVIGIDSASQQWPESSQTPGSTAAASYGQATSEGSQGLVTRDAKFP